jgi:hypothetical protein
MMSSPVRSQRAHTLGLASMTLMLVGSLGMSACTAVGSVTGGPGTAQGNGGSTGSGNTGAGSTTGTGGVTVVVPTTGSTSWYESLTAANCSQPATALASSRIWRLSATQWSNTIATALGVSAPDVTTFPPDQVDPRTGYLDDSTGDKITLGLAQVYFDKSAAAATAAAPGIITATPCLGQTPVTAACGQMFATTVGQKLFRRPVTTAEATNYATFLTGQIAAGDTAPVAVASTLQTMIMSPSFAFRTELGTSKLGPVDLTNDEIASLLSYSIADMPPDATLQAAQLSDPTVRTAQAERLAATPGAKAKLNEFWSEYLALGVEPTAPGLDQSTWLEAATFFSKVVWDNSGTLKDLLTAPYTYTTDKNLAAVYGSAQPDSTGKLTLDPTQRAGFLTSVAMLTQTAATSQAATVIHRGLLVRERVLCQTPPPPPPTVVPNPALIQTIPNATARQNYAAFAMTRADCNGCHSFFQPLGLAFENYDVNGKWQTQYPAPISMPIDPSGTLDSAGDAAGMYANAVGMAQKLGGSQMAQYCMSQQFAEFALGRSVSLDQEACMIRSMGDYVTSKQGQVRTLLASIAASPTLTRRIHQ